MSEKVRLSKIDELLRLHHSFLEEDDECYSWGTYTPRGGFACSQMNQLISNLKKEVSRRNLAEYEYKLRAIRTVARWIATGINVEEFTFVPVPPSHCKSDPEYDDRLVKILEIAKSINEKLDFCEIVTQKSTMPPSHLTECRNKPVQLENNYEVDKISLDNARSAIVIFDDVLTAGSHFRAMKNVILKNRPNIEIIGLFIARVHRQENS